MSLSVYLCLCLTLSLYVTQHHYFCLIISLSAVPRVTAKFLGLETKINTQRRTFTSVAKQNAATTEKSFLSGSIYSPQKIDVKRFQPFSSQKRRHGLHRWQTTYQQDGASSVYKGDNLKGPIHSSQYRRSL